MKYKEVIRGKLVSKSNSYQIVNIKGRPSLAKSKALKKYEESFFMQCGLRDMMITDMFKLHLNVYYENLRPDIDNSLKAILDCLQQCKAIKNDRQCVEVHVRKLVDKVDPRIEFVIETVEL